MTDAAAGINRAARSPIAVRPFTAFTVILSLTVIAAIVYPLLSLVPRLFVVDGQLSLKPLLDALAEPSLGKVIRDTFVYVGASGAIAMAAGTLLAWLVERTDVGLRRVTGIIPLIPLLLPALPGAIGWVLLLSPRVGYLNQLLRATFGSEQATGPFDIFTFWGMIVVTSVYLVPFSYLAVSAGLRNVDGSLDEAASVFGAGKLRTLLRISLPVIRPALFTAITLVVMTGLAMFSVPAILGPTAGVDVLAVLIFKAVSFYTPPRFDIAVCLGLLILIVLQPLIILQRLGVQSHRYQTVGGKGGRDGRIPLGKWRQPMRLAILCYLLLALLPLIGLLLVAFQRFWSETIDISRLSLYNFQYLFRGNQVTSAIKNSLLLAIGGSVIGMIIATLLAYQSERRKGGLTRIIDFVTTLPASVPHIVLGLAFLIAFSRPPINLFGTSTLLLVAYICIYMPQATQSARFAFTQIGREMAEAARVGGASELRTLVRILFPLAIPSLVSGSLIIAVLMLSEVNASILLVSLNNSVVGPTLYNLWDQGTVPPVAALGLIIVALNTVVALFAQKLGSGLGARHSRSG